MVAPSEKVLIPHADHNDWLSPRELTELTVPDIVRRVTALQEQMAAKAEGSEQLREVDEHLWSALRKTGIFYLMVPRERGGLGAGLQAFIDVILPIAEVDASLAWTTAFSVMHQWQLAQFPKRAQDEIWSALPYVTSAGSAFPPGTAKKVDGGYLVSGHHKYCSGIMHSAWVNSFIALTSPAGEKQAFLCTFPIANATVLDTWRVAGMASTGSHDIVFKDVFVPEHRAVAVESIRQGCFEHESPAYRIPFSTFLALVIAVPAVGAARGEVKRFKTRLLAPGPDGKPPDKPLARVGLGRASMDANCAEMIIRSTATEAEELVQTALMTKSGRVRMRAQCAYSAQISLKVLRDICDLSSSSAQFLSSPMQRALRDVTMIASHATLEFGSSMDEHARDLLGMPSAWWLA